MHVGRARCRAVAAVLVDRPREAHERERTRVTEGRVHQIELRGRDETELEAERGQCRSFGGGECEPVGRSIDDGVEASRPDQVEPDRSGVGEVDLEVSCHDPCRVAVERDRFHMPAVVSGGGGDEAGGRLEADDAFARRTEREVAALEECSGDADRVGAREVRIPHRLHDHVAGLGRFERRVDDHVGAHGRFAVGRAEEQAAQGVAVSLEPCPAWRGRCRPGSWARRPPRCGRHRRRSGCRSPGAPDGRQAAWGSPTSLHLASGTTTRLPMKPLAMKSVCARWKSLSRYVPASSGRIVPASM